MIGEDGRVYRDKPYPQPTPEFNEAFNKLRQDLAKGPKSDMTLEDDTRSELRRRLDARNTEIASKAAALGLSIPDYIAKMRAERINGAVHGSDIRRTEPDPRGGGQPEE